MTILLVGGLGTKVLLVLVTPFACEPALEKFLMPANGLLLHSEQYVLQIQECGECWDCVDGDSTCDFQGAVPSNHLECQDGSGSCAGYPRSCFSTSGVAQQDNGRGEPESHLAGSRTGIALEYLGSYLCTTCPTGAMSLRYLVRITRSFLLRLRALRKHSQESMSL